MRRLLLALALLLACRTGAFAQFETGAITGTVRDESGGVLPGVTVTLTNIDTGVVQTAATNDAGVYEFFTLRLGRYDVRAELQGFTSSRVSEVAVGIGARQRVDIALGVGQLSESVDVSASRLGLERDSSQRGQVVTSEQAVALPLNGREYSALVLLTTGVRASALNTGGLTPREGAFNVNGLRSTFNNFLLDGVDNNAYGTSNQGFSNQVMQPPPDALDEFKVVTNNMSAEYGRSGGATINVAYKSGTNRFSGSAWEFFRDDSLNAVGFFRPPVGTEPQLQRNQFGLVAGGPIVRNRAFFFTDYEAFRQDQRFVSFASIPTLEDRQGVLPVDVRDPRTGIVYPAGATLPMTTFARTVLGQLPEPTGPGRSNNYRRLRTFESDIDKFNVKLDSRLGTALNVFGRYGYRDSDVFDEPVLPLPVGGDSNGNLYTTNKQLAIGATWMQSPTRLLEARFGWSSTSGGKDPVNLGTPDAFEAYGITGLPTDPRVAGGLPTQMINGFTNLGRQATNPQWQYPDVWNPKINYSWVVDRHSLKFGYEFQHIQTEVQDVNPLYGRDAYAGQFTRPSTSAASTLYNLSDFMFGYRSQYALSNILVANLRQNMQFAYVQDDWRVNDTLTLNLGLRYEYATPHWERDNILSNFDPMTRTMVLAQDGSLEDRSTIQPDRNNLGPRLGFAYTVTPKTVSRGGYGVSFIHFHRAGGANLLPINGPQVINAVENQVDPASAGFRPTELGYPADLTDPSRFNPLRANITYMPRDYESSRVQSWYVSVQRELWRNTILDVAYVGNRADGQLLFANLNQAVPNAPGESLPLQARRPIAEYGDITYSWNGGFSRYHSAQIRFESRLRGLMLLNSLTLSRARDNGAGSLESPNGNFPAPQDFYNMAAEEALSGYNQPYNNTTSVVWDVPVGRDRKWLADVSPWLDLLIGGWQVAGISTLAAGEAVTFIYTPTAQVQVSGIQQDFRGANNYRPNIVGDPYGDRDSTTSYFNSDMVQIPTGNNPFGNASRNNVRGPDFWQVDLALSKNVRLPIGSNTQLQVRVEAFNLLNHTNFRAPVGNRSANNFGSITSTYDPRQLQLGVKVSF
ncbi:Outer membrane receptor for ferrienterochelin and colicins [Luteitalea pratensis]|uniref:Outer membrane receptor for ferrienterochelin and colicins n=1 Tax=Luteitalea pratensis TaxID=1855912 RepID=A0A143PMC8_LUTPR|nr:TonB-dependent receptor [Luteitalea pratensis]AMY09757.1 Outer membrane receptor for ferrienterochelin and colicins [Luteitalea pratensis]